MLRTIFVAVIILVGMFYAVRKPFYALLFYLWLAYFRPEQWVWSNWVGSLNLSYWVGLLLLFTSVFRGSRFHLRHRSGLIIVFGAHCLLSTAFSNYGEWAWFFFQEFTKVLLVSYLITVLVDSVEKFRLTIFVMCLSLGMEAAKQGWAQFVLNPGAANNNTIPFLGDNNGVAIGMFMLMPLCMALAQTTPIRRNKFGYRFLGVGVFIRGLTTYSRGAFLSIAAWAAFYVLRTKRKVLSVLAIAFVAYFAFSVMPPEYWDRMRSVEANDEGQRDASAQGRIHYWYVGLEMLKARPLIGVGFNAFQQAYDDYDFSRGAFGDHRNAHSTWFGTAGDLGYPGLALFILILVSSFYAALKVELLAKRTPVLKDLQPFALGIQSGFVVMIIGGTFLHLQYSEMLWHLFALTMALQRISREALDEETAATRTVVRPPMPGARVPGMAGRPAVDPRPAAAYAPPRASTPRPR
jgi:probable O-glycosylation ligase (exosortase A-associated)